MFGLSVLLKEKAEMIIEYGEDTANAVITPDNAIVIQVKDNIISTNKDSFELHIDGSRVYKCDSFLDCVGGLSVYTVSISPTLNLGRKL